MKEQHSTPHYTFSTDRWLQAIMLIGGLMFELVSFVSFKENSIAGGILLLFGLLFLGLFALMSRAVILSEHGIGMRWFWYKSFLSWNEISAIVNPSDNQFTLVSRDQQTNIKIHSLISGFGIVIEIIRQKRPDLWLEHKKDVIHTNKMTLLLTIPIILLPIILIISAISVSPMWDVAEWTLLFFAIIWGAGLVVLFLKYPLSIHLATKEIIIKRVIGKVIIRGEDIVNITIGVVTQAEGVPYQGVTIVVRNQKNGKLKNYNFLNLKEGSAVLYTSLVSWMQYWGFIRNSEDNQAE